MQSSKELVDCPTTNFLSATSIMLKWSISHSNLQQTNLSAWVSQKKSKKNLKISVPQRWRDGYLGASAWLIDFFAPWCPPCKAMMPEFRKMSTTLEAEGLRLGTVDCVMHPQLCSDYQINSYPTQILVNGSNHPGRLSITSCFR